MRVPFRFPIGYKLGVVSLALLLLAMVPTAFRTSSVFKKVSKDREADVNRSQADARASEASVILEKIVEKVSFFAPLMLRRDGGQAAGGGTSELLRQTFMGDPDIVSIEVLKRGPKGLESVDTLVNAKYLQSYKLDTGYLKVVDRQRPFPVQQVLSGEVAVRNRSLPKGAPLFTLGVPLVKGADGLVSHIAVTNVRLAALQKAFAEQADRLIYLVDNQGVVFAHPNEKLALSAASLKSNEVVKKATASDIGKGELVYRNKEAKANFISAYSKLRYGLTVITEASEKIILEPAAYVERQVFYFTCLVLSGSLIVIAMFSLTITRPVQRLVTITKEIAKGNFGIPVARLVATNDEVGTLAVSFDAMLAGLRERDKVKNLFNKFHGSSVTESLLSTDKVQMGGSRKKVVVFFSDIRGFTATSEVQSPEQVVSMLNEYFTIMVRIILNNNGIVDKFIGDAIMAVWGTPKGSDDDCLNAVKACLEMRKALAELNELRASRGEAPLKIGIGLHTGEAISGNIGSEERMEFTAIGDTVNMTSRIEDSTKAFGTDLLISDDVAREVRGRFIIEEAGRTKVKGKTEPLVLHKVRGFVRADGVEEIVKTEYSDYEAEKADKVEVV